MKYEYKESAVFFVDILGMSALTEGTIDLSKIEKGVYESIYNVEILGSNVSTNPNQRVAAWTLSRFRELLQNIDLNYDVNISQLSDCAFVWSENVSELLLAASEIMWKATLNGVLCRGGMSYGEVIIPINDTNSLGSFILGDAVTRAAKHERSGKGCRVFTDSNAVSSFYRAFPGKSNSSVLSSTIYREIFAPIKNPLDFTIYDEFKWYLFYDLRKLTSVANKIDRCKMAMYMTALISLLRHSPYYAWNSLNKHGVIHLAASIEFISSNISTHIGHNEALLSSEYSELALPAVTRSFDIVKKHFRSFSINAFSLEKQEEILKHMKISEQLLSQNIKDRKIE